MTDSIWEGVLDKQEQQVLRDSIGVLLANALNTVADKMVSEYPEAGRARAKASVILGLYDEVQEISMLHLLEATREL